MACQLTWQSMTRLQDFSQCQLSTFRVLRNHQQTSDDDCQPGLISLCMHLFLVMRFWNIGGVMMVGTRDDLNDHTRA